MVSPNSKKKKKASIAQALDSIFKDGSKFVSYKSNHMAYIGLNQGQPKLPKYRIVADRGD